MRASIWAATGDGYPMQNHTLSAQKGGLMITVKPKQQPKWYEFRKWLCKWLVTLARWVEPRSPEVYAFYMQQMQDLMITGRTMTRVDPFEGMGAYEVSQREKEIKS